LPPHKKTDELEAGMEDEEASESLLCQDELLLWVVSEEEELDCEDELEALAKEDEKASEPLLCQNELLLWGVSEEEELEAGIEDEEASELLLCQDELLYGQ